MNTQLHGEDRLHVLGSFRKQKLPVMKVIQLYNNSEAIFIIVAAGLLQVTLPSTKGQFFPLVCKAMFIQAYIHSLSVRPP